MARAYFSRLVAILSGRKTGALGCWNTIKRRLLNSPRLCARCEKRFKNRIYISLHISRFGGESQLVQSLNRGDGCVSFTDCVGRIVNESSRFWKNPCRLMNNFKQLSTSNKIRLYKIITAFIKLKLSCFSRLFISFLTFSSHRFSIFCRHIRFPSHEFDRRSLDQARCEKV